ncbi:hypothetical protein ACOI70_002060 [Salmonella enterica]
MSMRPADMPERRAELYGNSHFQRDRIRKLIEFIDDAGEENGHCLKPELQRLNRFDLKYWSDRSPGMEETEVTFADAATGAIINTHRPSLTDFIRELFDRISEQKRRTTTPYHERLNSQMLR